MKRLNFPYWYTFDFSICFVLSGRNLHRDALLLPTALGFTIPLPYHVFFFPILAFWLWQRFSPLLTWCVCTCVCTPILKVATLWHLAANADTRYSCSCLALSCLFPYFYRFVTNFLLQLGWNKHESYEQKVLSFVTLRLGIRCILIVFYRLGLPPQPISTVTPLLKHQAT